MSRQQRRAPASAAWRARARAREEQRDAAKRPKPIGGNGIAALNFASPWFRRMYFNPSGQPIGLGTYVWIESQDHLKRIGRDIVGPWRVSTVWLGVDHGWGTGLPVIFETMVFYDGPGVSDTEQFQDRYCTREAALAGHRAVVEAIRVTEEINA